MSKTKLISVVIAIYNKASALPDTLTSLCGQDGLGNRFILEFVLVDDASQDHSLVIATNCLQQYPVEVVSIANESNAGPSIRLNQGMLVARGDFILVYDADDIAPSNLLQTMLNAIEKEHLDYVYGRSKKTMLTAPEVAKIALPANPKLLISEQPLLFTMKRNIVHPVALVRREVALRSGGCDEKVFIQDESLALRLALASHRVGLLLHPCRYVLMGSDTVVHLSDNIAQQHHDQYRTYINLLEKPGLTSTQSKAIARRAVSPWWKSYRGTGFYPGILCCYLLSRIFPKLVLAAVRPAIEKYF
ncbi:glycosyltransferase family 2 protein, partial [Desulfurivibrio sp. C05AmB]|uniref:glycosyltransferase family 2 protein n=1 Tax=Desulfurivibrio sp. C05AmB TaxID=3374371 RepID=UPI00376F381D